MKSALHIEQKVVAGHEPSGWQVQMSEQTRREKRFNPGRCIEMEIMFHSVLSSCQGYKTTLGMYVKENREFWWPSL